MNGAVREAVNFIKPSFWGPNRSTQATKNQQGKVKTMKLGNSTILAIVIAGCFSLTAYVMGQGRSGGPAGGPGYGPSNNPGMNNMSSQGQQNSQFGRDTATSNTNASPGASASPTVNPHIKTSPTPPGKHLGWQKGKHNPHRTASASPSATASATATP
jgi:hypothetical protein